MFFIKDTSLEMNNSEEEKYKTGNNILNCQFTCMFPLEYYISTLFCISKIACEDK